MFSMTNSPASKFSLICLEVSCLEEQIEKKVQDLTPDHLTEYIGSVLALCPAVKKITWEQERIINENFFFYAIENNHLVIEGAWHTEKPADRLFEVINEDPGDRGTDSIAIYTYGTFDTPTLPVGAKAEFITMAKLISSIPDSILQKLANSLDGIFTVINNAGEIELSFDQYDPTKIYS